MLSMRYLLVLFMILGFGGNMAQASVVKPKPKEIVLLGASIGYYWNIPDLPNRTKVKGYTFEYVGSDGFDKSKPFGDILNRANPPEAIFLKECAAYFPGDLVHYQNLMKGWVSDCQKKGIVPFLVTVAPVRDPAIWKLQYWKNIVKKVIYPGRPTVEARLRDLNAFNDWIRKYALEQNLPILDLEKTLRISETDRRLREDFDGGDGLHLNQNAYRVLDQAMLATLNMINWDQLYKKGGGSKGKGKGSVGK